MIRVRRIFYQLPNDENWVCLGKVKLQLKAQNAWLNPRCSGMWRQRRGPRLRRQMAATVEEKGIMGERVGGMCEDGRQA
ncbi:hypothetical protein C2W62_42725 [Candidatus Entotheonella serta]|nr:hypothetical protein C2W62_42725 [Candidatus Entotheonella serta]